MVASEPWSGYYPEPKLIWLAAHTTQFTEPGWIYFRHGSGVGTFKNGGTFVTLTSPDRKHVTIVLETLTKITQLNVWYSNVANDTYFIRKDSIKVTGGLISLSLNVDEMYTLTTVTTGHKGQYDPPPPSEPFPLPFREDFESYTIGEEPYLFSQQIGGFEVALANDSHHYVMRQVTPQRPVPWCVAEAIGRPITVIGNVTWTDVHVEADFYVTGLPHRADGVIIASRLSKGGVEINLAVGVLFNMDTTAQTYSLTTDFVFAQKFASGSFQYNTGWNTAALLVKGSTAVGTVNNHTLFTVTDLPEFVSAGFVALGTIGFGQADFDNVKINST